MSQRTPSLISPLIEAGTVYRGAGRIDHASGLRTIDDRWSTVRLTARDTAAASLGDGLSLSVARDDHPIAGVAFPVSSEKPSNASPPSRLDMVHAAKVAALPILNEKGHYDDVAPVLATSADVATCIRDRTVAWYQHVQRQRRRRGGTTPSAGVPTSST